VLLKLTVTVTVTETTELSVYWYHQYYYYYYYYYAIIYTVNFLLLLFFTFRVFSKHPSCLVSEFRVQMEWHILPPTNGPMNGKQFINEDISHASSMRQRAIAVSADFNVSFRNLRSIETTCTYRLDLASRQRQTAAVDCYTQWWAKVIN